MGSKLGDRKRRHDKYFRQAKRLQFASRAVFKLEEMDAKFQLLKRGMFVLDLGAAPGAWTQYAAAKVGKRGGVVGIDLLEITTGFPAHVTLLQGDMTRTDFLPFVQERGRPFDLIMSDMAPNTTGIRFTDAVRSATLVNAALDLVPSLLSPQGKFVAKIFRGAEFDETLQRTRTLFRRVKVFKPKSSRQESKEQYIVGWERRLPPPS